MLLLQESVTQKYEKISDTEISVSHSRGHGGDSLGVMGFLVRGKPRTMSFVKATSIQPQRSELPCKLHASSATVSEKTVYGKLVDLPTTHTAAPRPPETRTAPTGGREG